MHNPLQKNLDVTFDLVRYLACIEELGIVYSRNDNRKLILYCHTFWYLILRIYGPTCWIHAQGIPKPSPHRAFQGIFVGFQPNSNTYLVYIPNQGKIIDSGDVKFDETRENSQEARFLVAETSIPPDTYPR